MNTINPSGIVVYSGQVGALDTVDPEGETAVIRTGGCGSAPIQLKHMRRVADRNPAAARPGRSVIAQVRRDLIGIGGAPEFKSQDIRGGTCITKENIMGVPIRHRNGIRIEVEPDAIAGFRGRSIIGYIDGSCIIDNCP